MGRILALTVVCVSNLTLTVFYVSNLQQPSLLMVFAESIRSQKSDSQWVTLAERAGDM